MDWFYWFGSWALVMIKSLSNLIRMRNCLVKSHLLSYSNHSLVVFQLFWWRNECSSIALFTVFLRLIADCVSMKLELGTNLLELEKLPALTHFSGRTSIFVLGIFFGNLKSASFTIILVFILLKDLYLFEFFDYSLSAFKKLYFF